MYQKTCTRIFISTLCMPLQISGVIFLHRPLCLDHCVEISLHLNSSVTDNSSTQRGSLAQSEIPHFALCPRKCPKEDSLDAFRTSPNLSPFSQDHRPVLPVVQYLKRVTSQFVLFCLLLLFQEVNLVLVKPLQLLAEVLILINRFF